MKAMSSPTIDHRGPEFGALTLKVLEKAKKIFQVSGEVVIYPSSGTGAWEANRVESGGGDTLSNSEILCLEPCRATL